MIDTTITSRDMEDYGYTWTGMAPLTMPAALAIFEEGNEQV